MKRILLMGLIFIVTCTLAQAQTSAPVEFSDNFESYGVGENPTAVYDFGGATWGQPGDPLPVDRYRVAFFDASNNNKVLRYYYGPGVGHFPSEWKLLKTRYSRIDKASVTFYFLEISMGIPYLRFAVNAQNNGYNIITHYTNDPDPAIRSRTGDRGRENE